MQLGSHYPSADYFKFKDAWFVDQDGKTGVENRNAWAITYSDNSWPQYSYTSDETKAKFAEDFENYVNSFSGNRNIAGVILHNEPGFFWLADRIFDYNPDTIAKFRLWLKKQFTTIDNLNSKWKTSYFVFGEIVPPGKPPVKEIGAWMDWRRFSVATIADFMEWESGLFASFHSGIPRTTNLDGPLNHWYGYRCADIYAFSTMMDKVGIDIYPSEWTDRVFIPYSMDMLMGTAQKREGHILECEVFTPKRWPGLSGTQRAGLLAAELWSFIGHGATGILMWGFTRGEDFFLTDGNFNERLLVCRDIAYQTKMINVVNFRRRPSKVAVCVDTDPYLYGAGIENKIHQQTPFLDSESHGFYAALADAHIQSDVLLSGQIQNGDIHEYKAIILPCSIMMDEKTAEILKEYVIAGGTLIVGSSFAIMDRWGQVSDNAPDYGLNRLFGVNYDKKELQAERNVSLWVPIENLSLIDARTLEKLENGKPGVTIKTNNKGRAVMFAGHVGSAYMNNSAVNNLSGVLKGIMSSASIFPFVELSSKGPEKPDSSLLEDNKGNLLLTFATHSSKGKMSKEIKDVEISVPYEHPSVFKAFMLSPTKIENGIVRSGPQNLNFTDDKKAKKIILYIGDIISASPVLIARDISPLLSVESSAFLRQGQEAEFKVTCCNPSKNKLEGTLQLKLPDELSDISGKVKVNIEAFKEQTVTLKFKVKLKEPADRLPISAIFICAGKPESISTVPVDIKVE